MTRCRSLSQPYDSGLSRMLIVYIATGLFFMLIPGTLVGVANLLTISAKHASQAVDARWIQAHGHAQIFGWLGTFILGVGYYTIPRLRLSSWSPKASWATYALWTSGVAMRWVVGSYEYQWRTLLPLSGVLETLAVIVFCASVFVAKPRAEDDARWRTSVLIITMSGWAMVAGVVTNAWMSFIVARDATAPVFPPDFNQRYLALVSWGFIVPFVWGFSTRWLPPLLALPKTFKGMLLPSVALLFVGVAAALTGNGFEAAILFLASSLAFTIALRLWEVPAGEPKLRGVHPATPFFIRLSYVWLAVAGVLAIVASMHTLPNGWVGASRHALTVGFFAAIVFAIGPRVLPAFFGVRALWSTRVMFCALLLINVGCFLRVTSQVLAYQGIAAFAWKTLPLSAIVEMLAVTLFAVNMMMTLRTGSPIEAYLEAEAERQRLAAEV